MSIEDYTDKFISQEHICDPVKQQCEDHTVWNKRLIILLQRDNFL